MQATTGPANPGCDRAIQALRRATLIDNRLALIYSSRCRQSPFRTHQAGISAEPPTSSFDDAGVDIRLKEASAVEITFKSVNEMVTDRLRQSILSGEFAEGEYLRQQTLPRRSGVSEIVIREALRRLHTEGLVEIQRRKSTRVSQLSAEELNEIYELRILLEALITRRAVPNCAAEDLEEAERILAAGEHERDPVRWLALNREFHNTLARPSRQPHLLKFADDLRVKVEL